jgi:FKBP-type peptidyl-prolyl cis-trans isomerase
MTLDELSKIDDYDDDDAAANDEEINEDEAFNSEDERTYGKYFPSDKQTQHRHRTTTGARNVALSVPIIALTPTQDPNQQLRSVEISKGSVLTISSVCLDVMECSFIRAKLLYRCTHTDIDDDQDQDNEAPFLALCNYLDKSRGGIGILPSNPVNLKVVGPCIVEFRAGALPGATPDDKINVFGVIEPLSKEFHGVMDDEDDEDYFPYADAFMSETSEVEEEEDFEDEEDDDEEEENNDVSEGKSKEPEKKSLMNDDNNSSGVASKETSSSRKRKQVDDVKEISTESNSNTTTDSHNVVMDQSKLTKAQRKKLAQEKAKQLEDTLAAARNNDTIDSIDSNNSEPQTKKSKKQAKKEKSAMESKSTTSNTQTRERRLAGGLIVSDVVLGVGAPVKAGKRISLHYTGTLRSTGKVFDKNHSKQHPLVFRQGTGEVIRGKCLVLVVRSHLEIFVRILTSNVLSLSRKTNVQDWNVD